MSYVHSDQIGTPRVATDSAQAVVWSASYMPFGQTTAVTGSAALNLRLPGQYSDAETGWYQNGFRDYVPGLGRYLESDPIGLVGGLNTYAYVGGNPLVAVDPTGLCQEDTIQLEDDYATSGTYGSSHGGGTGLDRNPRIARRKQQ